MKIEENVLRYFNPCFSTLKIPCKHENVYKHDVIPRFQQSKMKRFWASSHYGKYSRAKSLKIKVTAISVPGLLNTHIATLNCIIFLCATSRVETFLSKRRKVLPTITKHFQSFKWQHSFRDKTTYFCSTQLLHCTINSCPLTLQSPSALFVF